MRYAPSTMQWNEQTVWITGASSGIGAALARELAARGAALVLSGRSGQRLAAVAASCRAEGAAVQELVFDVGVAEERARAVAWVQALATPVTVLINNAGVSQRARVMDASAEVERALFEVNYWSAVELTRAVLPAMVAANRGVVAVVSSIAGLAGVPLRSSYSAAKAALLRYFGALGNELRGTGVSVTLVIPGFVQTEVSNNALTGSGSAHGVLDPNQAGGETAERTAVRIADGIARGHRYIYTGLVGRARLMVWLSRLAPSLLDRALSKQEPL